LKTTVRPTVTSALVCVGSKITGPITYVLPLGDSLAPPPHAAAPPTSAALRRRSWSDVEPRI
jgi:hypothetical protein